MNNGSASERAVSAFGVFGGLFGLWVLVGYGSGPAVPALAVVLAGTTLGLAYFAVRRRA